MVKLCLIAIHSLSISSDLWIHHAQQSLVLCKNKRNIAVGSTATSTRPTNCNNDSVHLSMFYSFNLLIATILDNIGSSIKGHYICIYLLLHVSKTPVNNLDVCLCAFHYEIIIVT